MTVSLLKKLSKSNNFQSIKFYDNFNGTRRGFFSVEMKCGMTNKQKCQAKINFFQTDFPIKIINCNHIQMKTNRGWKMEGLKEGKKIINQNERIEGE